MLFCWAIWSGIVGLGIAMLAWSLKTKAGIYQFPAVFAAAWLFYVAPQLYGVLEDPGKLPYGVIEDGGLKIALLLCLGCQVAGWIGYYAGIRWCSKRKNDTAAPVYSFDTLVLIGTGFGVMGAWSALRLAELSGGVYQHFVLGGHYSLEWRGITVRYVFLAEGVYFGLLLVAAALARKITMTRLFICGLLLVYPLACAIFLGRRQSTVLLACILVYSFYFGRGWQLSRVALLALGLGGVVFINLAPGLRERGEDLTALSVRELATAEHLLGAVRGGEFEGLVVQAAAIQRLRAFDYGFGFYNSVVEAMVPAQLVGRAQKDQMMARVAWAGAGNELYGWSAPYGHFPTGPLTVFRSFWFFGVVLYSLLGLGAAFVWVQADIYGDVMYQAMYTMVAVLVPMSVADSMTRLLPALLFVIPGICICFGVARAKARGIRPKSPHGGRPNDRKSRTVVREAGTIPRC